MSRRLATAIPAAWLGLLLIFVVAGGTDQSPISAPKSPVTVRPWIDTGDRETVESLFATWYESEEQQIAWTGSYDGCNAGDSSDALRAATIKRINFFRAMAGVPAVIEEDKKYSGLAQAGALMMSAEGRLSHEPGPDYECFSDDGELAAANSNLYLGRVGPWAIDGYIEDPGDKNIDVGHRITILHPPTTRMGVGHVAGDKERYPANVLWVFDDDVFDKETPIREPGGFVAWPPRGYVPGELVYPRWSFTLDEADFSQAELTMTVNGEAVPYNVVARLSKDGEVPSSVLVWEPSHSVLAANDDVTYTITVSGVGGVTPNSLAMTDGEVSEGESLTTFSYEVTVLARQDQGFRSTVMAALEPASDQARSVIEVGRRRLRALGL